MAIKSVISKVKKAATSYAKNVAGGAKIVGSAVSSAVKKVGGSSQTGAVLNATLLPGAKLNPSNLVTGNINLSGAQIAQNIIASKKAVPRSGALVNQPQPPSFQGPAINTKTGASTYSPALRSSGGSGSSALFQGPAINNLTGASTYSSSLRTGDTGGSSTLSTGTRSTPTSNVINAPTVLNPYNDKIVFPEPAATDYSQYIPTPIEQQVADATKEKDTAFQDMLKSIVEPPSKADAYKKAQKETQILKEQQLVNDLTGQLNGIVARGQANQLSLVGQGRGIPEAIIGGQQAQIGRETAIAALPIQAQLSAAQGNLEMANDNLDTLFKIYSEDAKNEYEYKKEIKKAVYDFATEKEKKALEKLDKLEDRAYKETQDLHTEQNMYAKMAFETGQSSLGAKIAKLDYKSPTFKTDLERLTGQIVDEKRNLEIQKLQSDLVNAGTTINPKVLATTQFKAAQAAQNLKLTLEKAKAAVEKYGNYEKLSGRGAGILNSLKVQLRSEISTALEQGVVVPGEAAAFDQIAGQLNSSFFGIPNVRNSVTLAGLNSLSSSMDGRLALQKAALTNTYKVTSEQIDTLLNIADLSEQEFTDMDALVE